MDEYLQELRRAGVVSRQTNDPLVQAIERTVLSPQHTEQVRPTEVGFVAAKNFHKIGNGMGAYIDDLGWDEPPKFFHIVGEDGIRVTFMRAKNFKIREGEDVVGWRYQNAASKQAWKEHGRIEVTIWARKKPQSPTAPKQGPKHFKAR